ncbi:MAG: hypothetical protein LBI19_02520 [Oscillospiraceae bacterium]|jgi:hypothetical protein|nr:hypothetical protein [Oscillospiraceae bacterium]
MSRTWDDVKSDINREERNISALKEECERRIAANSGPYNPASILRPECDNLVNKRKEKIRELERELQNIDLPRYRRENRLCAQCGRSVSIGVVCDDCSSGSLSEEQRKAKSNAALEQSMKWRQEGRCRYCGCGLGFFKKCKSPLCGKKN